MPSYVVATSELPCGRHATILSRQGTLDVMLSLHLKLTQLYILVDGSELFAPSHQERTLSYNCKFIQNG